VPWAMTSRVASSWRILASPEIVPRDLRAVTEARCVRKAPGGVEGERHREQAPREPRRYKERWGALPRGALTRSCRIALLGRSPIGERSYPGEHPGIVTQDTLGAGAAQLRENTVASAPAQSRRAQCLWRVALRRPRKPTDAVTLHQGGKRYRYYFSQGTLRSASGQEARGACLPPNWNRWVMKRLFTFLASGKQVLDASGRRRQRSDPGKRWSMRAEPRVDLPKRPVRVGGFLLATVTRITWPKHWAQRHALEAELRRPSRRPAGHGSRTGSGAARPHEHDDEDSQFTFASEARLERSGSAVRLVLARTPSMTAPRAATSP